MSYWCPWKIIAQDFQEYSSHICFMVGNEREFYFGNTYSRGINYYVHNFQVFIELSQLKIPPFQLYLVTLLIFLGTLIFIATLLTWRLRTLKSSCLHSLLCTCLHLYLIQDLSLCLIQTYLQLNHSLQLYPMHKIQSLSLQLNFYGNLQSHLRSRPFLGQ